MQKQSIFTLRVFLQSQSLWRFQQQWQALHQCSKSRNDLFPFLIDLLSAHDYDCSNESIRNEIRAFPLAEQWRKACHCWDGLDVQKLFTNVIVFLFRSASQFQQCVTMPFACLPAVTNINIFNSLYISRLYQHIQIKYHTYGTQLMRFYGHFQKLVYWSR